jgi:hypothetical protein
MLAFKIKEPVTKTRSNEKKFDCLVLIVILILKHLFFFDALRIYLLVLKYPNQTMENVSFISNRAKIRALLQV